jgi:hypothetical protein
MGIPAGGEGASIDGYNAGPMRTVRSSSGHDPVGTTPESPRARTLSFGRLPEELAAAAVYVAAAIALTLPAWAHPLSSTIGDPGDSDKFMGFLAWFPFAVTHGHNPLHMTWIDLPTGINAMWDTTMPFAAFLVWPVRALLGIVAAYNALLLGALALNGLCTFLWLRRHTRYHLAALVGGLLMVAGPYAAARSYGHLNLVLYFPLPLMFLVLEDIVREPKVRSLRRGMYLGVLAAIQLLCTEEALALAAVALFIALALAAAFAPRQAWRRLLQSGPAVLGVAVGFVVVGGLPLAYQFLGPSVVHGAIQPPDLYVNDLLNFIVPTSATAISLGGPGMLSGPVVPWTGNPIEWNAYIGIPLLLTFGFTMARWWRNRWLLVLGMTALAMIVLSLGPHLHVNGVDHTRFPLPERLLDKLSVFDNILPNRFSLLMDFGLAGVLAVFIDHVLRAADRRHRVVGAAAVVLVAVSLWPGIVPASAAVVPRYFQSGGDVARIPSGTAVLVFPIPYVGPPSTAEPALWQAVADFRFKMVSGASISAGPDGTESFGSTAEPLKCVVDSLQTAGSADACNTPPSAILDQLHSLAVRYVIMGPTPHQAEISAYLTSLTGRSPISDQGVLTWTL